MQIEKSNTKDAEQIFDLMKNEGRRAYTLELVKDLIETEISLSFKAIENDEIIGAIGARGEGDNSAWLYFVIVKETERGKGISGELIQTLFEKAKSMGIKKIALDTPDKEYFSKFGFEEVGRIKDWYETKDQVIMYKDLTN